MKGSNIFVEIGSKEIEAPDTGLESFGVLLDMVVKVYRGFRCEWADLLVTSSIPCNEQDWDALDLYVVSLAILPCLNCFLTIVSSSIPSSR